jgi:hypothetical protein
MSNDRDRDRRPDPIAGPPEGGGYNEYEHPYPRGGGRQELRPDSWDQLPPTPYRPQGRPPAQSQADGFARRTNEGDRDERSRGGERARDESGHRSDRGRYAGRGPKGYQRSDERIRETVSEALARDGDLDASEIEVSVERGEVTLNGSVPNRWSKRLAEDLAQDLPGVKELHNRLRVEDAGH